MSQAIAEVLATAFFYALGVAVIGAFITWVFDRESSPPKLTQTQARNKARLLMWKTDVQLFWRKTMRYFRRMLARYKRRNDPGVPF